MHPEELVPLAEGARRLGLAHDTARKHLSAGTLRGEKRQGRWWVWAPVPDDMPDASGTNPASSGTMPDALIARFESEVSYLRSELAERTEEIRRRDHIIAGLVERVKEIPATNPDTPRNDESAPLSADPPIRAPESSQRRYSLSQTPVSDTLGVGWRRWWRRIREGGGMR